MTDATVDVQRNEAESRYEIWVDGKLAGFTEYHLRDGVEQFPHTEIDKAYGGQGLGTKLVAGAMADEAARGATVQPICPFVVKYLKENDVDGLTVDWPEPRS